ncbi:MAG: ATP-binding protein [Dehalococcoidia bacterium]
MQPLSELLGPERVPRGDAIRTDMSSAARSTDPAAATRGERAGACSLCDGARFVRVTDDPEHPDFGRPVPCACARREDADVRRRRLSEYSRLGALGRLSFGTLLRGGRSADPAEQERYGAAVEAAERFAEAPEGWLVITGIPGCGKTHLAAAIANRRIERGHPALFLTVADLLDHLRSAYRDDAELAFDELLEQVRTAPLLVLDDLDAYAETAWAREKFFQVVSHRFNAALPTVFTCARPPQRIDPRLGSRLTDPALSQVLELGHEAMPRYFAVGAMTRDRLERFTFELFRPTGQSLRGELRRNLEGAFRLARQWAGEPDGWLVFIGKNGCGKTHLAAAIAGFRLEQGDAVGFANVPDLLDELRASFAPTASERFDTLFRRLIDVPVLVLDDLGAHQASPWAEEKLYQVLNHRHLARMATVVTTNRELKQMEPRIASRLADLKTSTVYEITAPDFRTGGVS